MVFPGGQHRAFGVGGCVAAYQVQRLDFGVHPGDALVEDEGIGDDGAGHAAGLGYVRHTELLRHLPRDTGAGVASTASSSLAAASMPACSVSVAASTARCGTETRRTRSARSVTLPSSHPLTGKRCTPAASAVKTQYSRRAAVRAVGMSAASATSAG